MRFSLFVTVALTVLASCGNSDSGAPLQSSVDANKGAVQLTRVQWLDSAQDYGKIQEGQKLAISFRFRNTGEKPLIIESVNPTCGCTVAEYPKQPIAPGSEGEITGAFDSNGREGLQRKHITVRTNTNPADQHVSFQVEVIAKPRKQS